MKIIPVVFSGGWNYKLDYKYYTTADLVITTIIETLFPNIS